MPLHQRLIALQAEYTLRSPSIAETLDCLLAVPTLEACCAKGLITRHELRILHRAVAITALIRAVFTHRHVFRDAKIWLCRVKKEDVARVAAHTIYVPMFTIYICVSSIIGARKAFFTEPVSLSLLQDLTAAFAQIS